MTFPLMNSMDLNQLEDGNVTQWMNSVRSSYNTLEQARWTQANIDCLFYAGEQRFINSYFSFFPQNNFQNFQFNLIQQPINMVTGYQRQHRKAIGYVPVEGNDQQYSDDITDVEVYANTLRKRLEKFSKGCEFSAIQGMCLAQPYLDWRGEDPINGSLDLEIWPYNSFFIDPFFRDTTEMSDCNFIWTQKYITKEIARQYWPDKKKQIDRMTGYNSDQSYNFYFLPENYNSIRSNFLCLSQIWYQSTRKKKFLYDPQSGLTYDYYDEEKFIDVAAGISGFEVIEIEVPTWKLVVVLNNEVMYKGRNPLMFDRCPFVPIFWNYDPHLQVPDLRCRSLIRCMRDIQFLMNRRIILNHDISESSVNTGFIRTENMLVDENATKKVGQGHDIILKEGYDISQIQKIIPNAVPPSDMELAEQLATMIFKVSGVNEELMGMAKDSQTGIQEMLRQGAGLVTLQKYFDQWDVSLKMIGEIDREIVQYMWPVHKIQRILGREPSLQFQTKIFSRSGVLVEEGNNTTTQQQQNFANLLQLNEALGGILPPTSLLKRAVIHDKNAIVEEFEQSQQAQQHIAQEQSQLELAKMDAEIQKIQAGAVNEVASARERAGRTLSNEALLIERSSELTQNRAAALKDTADALKTLLESNALFGEAEMQKQKKNIDLLESEQIMAEDIEELKTQKQFDEELSQFAMPQLMNQGMS